MAPQPATTAILAKYLTTGYWAADGGWPHKFAGPSISVNLAGLDPNETVLAKAAFTAWETVANLKFTYVTSGGKITFNPNYEDGRDPDADATTDAWYPVGGGTTDRAQVKIHSDWLYGRVIDGKDTATTVVGGKDLPGYGAKIGDYSFHTYMHEIGHALGLGHPSTYPGPNIYANATFQNDSWQQSVMSYLDQDQNPNIAANKAITVSPMMADIMAIQMLYGAPTTGPTAGNTIYGVGTNLTTYLKDVFGPGAGHLTTNAMTIYDISGTDSIVFSDDTRNQAVNLNAGTFSNVYGKIGNLGIAANTTIENYTAGSGNDLAWGNAAANKLVLGAGQDRAWGGAGADSLSGGAGNDGLWGGAGNDAVAGGDGNDTVAGDAGNDVLSGGAGLDVFVFNGGRDTITYFHDNQDTLQLDDALWGGGGRTATYLLAFANLNTAGTDLVFTFGSNTLTIRGLTNESLLRDDFSIV